MMVLLTYELFHLDGSINNKQNYRYWASRQHKRIASKISKTSLTMPKKSDHVVCEISKVGIVHR